MRVKGALAPRFESLVEGYHEQKYPAEACELLVEAFKDPSETSDGDIERALRWKYGHWRKDNSPPTAPAAPVRTRSECGHQSAHTPAGADALSIMSTAFDTLSRCHLRTASAASPAT
jgi:hypothetical protein